MNRLVKAIIPVLAMAFFTAHAAIAKDVKFEITLDRSKIALGESAQLGISFYGTQSMPAPDVGNIAGLEVRYIGPSTMMTVINGQVSSSVTHMYKVLPLKIGRFQLGPFSFKYKQDSYSSNPVFLDVVEEKSEKPHAPEGEGASLTEKLNLEDRIFLTLNVDKPSAYVNELLPVMVKLYVNRLNVSDIQLPTFAQEGFSKVEFREPKQYREEHGGALYDVLEFKTNLFATRPGDYKLGPAKIKCNIMVKKTLPRERDAFFEDDRYRDSFFEDFFTRYERYPVELKSSQSQLIISPLPHEAMPKNFSGTVGDYQFIFNAGPVKVKVGDPITVRMDINGHGNFNTVLGPRLEDAAGFKVYEPQVKTGENTKTFTQVLIPETDQVTQIPRAVFSYFDPEKREYKTIVQGPIAIQVEKGKDEAPSQVVGPPPVKPGEDLRAVKEDEPSRDILYIKDSPGRWAQKGYAIYENKIFLGFVAVPLLLMVGLYIAQERADRLKRDTVYAGRIFALRSAKKGLLALRHQLKMSEPKIFYETLFKALQDYLGNRLHIPPAGITAIEIEGGLASKDVDLNILRKVKDLFDMCDRARFAFLKIDNYKLRDDLKEFEEVIRYFERNKI